MNKKLIRKIGVTAVFVSLAVAIPLESINEVDASSEKVSGTSQSRLLLGSSDLFETRFTQQVTQGVKYTSIHRGRQSSKDYFTVDIEFFTDKVEADQLQQNLRGHGVESTIIQINNDPYNDIKKETLGYVVRTGKFSTQDEATTYSKQLKDKGFNKVRVTYTGYDGKDTKGPWSIHVLEIDRNLTSKLSTTLSKNHISGKETVSSIAKRVDSIFSVNGSYFVVEDKDGTPGDIAGISAYRGELISEATGDRTGLMLTGEQNEIASFSTHINVLASDGSVSEIDGLNRQIGVIRVCGKNISDTRTGKPEQEGTCFDDNELVLYKAIYGSKTPSGKGTDVVLDKSGKVLKVLKVRGASIPKDGSVISGIGYGAEWLNKHAKVGKTLNVRTKILKNNKEIKLNKDTNIVAGAPVLLRDNQYVIPADKEGFNYEDDFFYRFGINRHPRTLVGIKPNGNLLFVVVDGRNPAVSVGINFAESAELMKSLGAKDAMNLDGGGSTTMVINGLIINQPSDVTGERSVADAVSLFK